MNMKILTLLIITLVISVSASMVFARNLPAITAANKLGYKEMLKNYFHPVLHGYGIGFTNDTYITAKWHITDVKILPMSKIKEIISGSNASDWSEIKEQIRNAIQTEGTTITKGRIKIGDTNYLLTNIQTSNNTASADIRKIPNFDTCAQSNTSAEDCENSAEKIGDISLTKKTKAIEETSTEQRVWAGTLNFNNVTYTFVTFAFPK